MRPTARSWWDRNRYSRNQTLLRMGTADESMLALLNEVRRIEQEAKRQTAGVVPK